MLPPFRIMPHSTTIRLLVVDDHPAFRAGIVAILQQEPDICVVAEAGDGEDAILACRKHLPSVVLMDLRLPKLSGVDATLRIMQEMTGINIIVLTTYDGDEDIHRALRAGARSYLLKDAGAEDLIATIRGVSSGDIQLPSVVAARLAERLRRPELSSREREIVQQLSHGNSNKEIAAALGITEDTVKGHLKSIFIKLGVCDRTQAVIAALQHGIVHLDQ
jgi:DNA-binding NarL/FixJ family response regulator